MSVIDNLKAKVRAPYQPPQAPDIQQKIAEAEAALSELEAGRDLASFNTLSNPGAQATLDTLNADVKAAQDRIALLKAAYRGALESDRVETRRLQKNAIETAQRSVIASLALRDKAADLFAVAIAEADKQYRIMHNSHERARAAWAGAQQEFPRGALSANDLTRLAADESWRHTSGAIGGDSLSLPAPTFSKLEYQFNPEAVPRIDDELRKDTAWLKEQIAKVVPR